MATHKSAIKRYRQSLRRRDVNRKTRSQVRLAFKKARAAAQAGDTTAAKSAMRDAERAIAKAATKGVYHKKNAARKVSRLWKLSNKLSAKKA